MSFLRRLLGGGASSAEADDGAEVASAGVDQQAVVGWLRLADAELTEGREQTRVFGLEDRVMRALDESGVGTYDTNDLERGYFRMHMYGPDADRIVEVVSPLLVESAAPGSYLAVRRGPAGTSEERVEF